MDTPYSYIVPIQADASDHERRWAWRFTVISRANGKCQECGTPGKLDACHLIPKRRRPDLRFDPDNGIAMCRSCHMSHDHKRGHRPSGRPVGMKMGPETGRKISESRRKWFAEPANVEIHRNTIRASWDKRGRKPERNCDGCGVALTRRQLSGDARFCSATCHYSFRTGKPRTGY